MNDFVFFNDARLPMGFCRINGMRVSEPVSLEDDNCLKSAD